jgi:hypothetical protein
MPAILGSVKRFAMILTVAIVLSALVSACGGPSPWEEHGGLFLFWFDNLPEQSDIDEIRDECNSTYGIYERRFVAPDDCDQVAEQTGNYGYLAATDIGAQNWELFNRDFCGLWATTAWLVNNGCPQVAELYTRFP